MLFHRDEFDSGILTNGKFQIHKDEVLNGSIELKHEDSSYDIREACIRCINNDCQGFVRSNKDGQTSYYTILSQKYEEGDDYMKSPEETELDQSIEHLTVEDIVPDRKEHTPLPVKPKSSDRSEIDNLLFYFILCVLVASITWVVLERVKPVKSIFSNNNCEDCKNRDL